MLNLQFGHSGGVSSPVWIFGCFDAPCSERFRIGLFTKETQKPFTDLRILKKRTLSSLA